MTAVLAGQVLGPKPGRAICSFWQGGVEIALRVLAPVVSMCLSHYLSVLQHQQKWIWCCRSSISYTYIYYRWDLCQPW